MGPSWTQHDYAMLRLVTSWPAIALTLCVVAATSFVFLYCELREVKGWRDKLALAVFVFSVVTGLVHIMFSAFVRGYGG